MTNITAKVIEHSSYNQQELITLEIYSPKFLDAEIEKHRMISSNSSSDRAIPIVKMMEQEYFIPDDIRLNERGMQGKTQLDDISKRRFTNSIIKLRKDTCNMLIGYKHVHKQHLNRYLLPYSMQKKVMTANKDQWDYFLSLRLHKAADPAIYELAKCINKAINESKPKELSLHQWHLPYISELERKENRIEDLLKSSSARCARVSYNNHNGTYPTKEEDFKLFDFLINEELPHATPTEHQALPMKGEGFNEEGISCLAKDGSYRSGNFHSFVQFRKILEDRQWKI